MLKLVSEHGAEMALSSVARRTATTPSKAHRYIVSLVEHGMLRQSDVIGLYDLGPAAAAVGFRALNRFDSTLMLQEAMSWLALRTGFPTCFYVWTPTGPDLAAIGARCRRHDAGTQASSNGAAHRIPHRRRFPRLSPPQLITPVLEAERQRYEADKLSFATAEEISHQMDLVKHNAVY